MSTTLTTKLEAVNEMIRTIGGSDVTALTPSNPEDVRQAESILEEVSREVQSRGWHFNTEFDVDLVPSGGQIVLASNVARAHIPRRQPSSSGGATEYGVVQGKIRNLTDHTFTINSTLKATIVYLYEFDEIPESVRNFIKVRAARIFHDRQHGDPRRARYTREDEFRARQYAQREQSVTGEFTIFDNLDTWRMFDRRDPLSHRS